MSGLTGHTVAILEARRSAELAKLIEQRGGAVYVAPALREEPVQDTREIVPFLDELCSGSLDLGLFLTGAGVRALVAAAEQCGRRDMLIDALGRLPILSRGPKPSSALRALELQVAFTTASPHTTAQILDVFRSLDPEGKRIGVVHHGGPSPGLIDGLQALGARTVEVQVYRWGLPNDALPIQGLIERLEAGDIDAIAFTSASQVSNLFTMAEALGQTGLLRRLLDEVNTIAAVGPVCAAAMREYSLRVDVQPIEPKMGPMVLALDKFLASRDSRPLRTQ